MLTKYYSIESYSGCPEGNYSDPTTRLCSPSCSLAALLFMDPSTKTCVKSCPSSPNLYNDPLTSTCSESCSGGYFAYDAVRVCVPVCPSTPAYFGNTNTFRCVFSCPVGTYAYSDNTVRQCVAICPQRVYSPTFIVDLYADNSTWSCVPLCPKLSNLYNFNHPTNSSIRTCVTTCPIANSSLYFA